MSLELLELIKKRGFDDKKCLCRQFTRKILQRDAEDIAPKIKEVRKVQFRPIEEVQKDIFIRIAKEEGRAEGRIEMAGKLLNDGVSSEIIARNAGLTLETIQVLQKLRFLFV